MTGKVEALVTGNLTKGAELKRAVSGKQYVALVVRTTLATTFRGDLRC